MVINEVILSYEESDLIIYKNKNILKNIIFPLNFYN